MNLRQSIECAALAGAVATSAGNLGCESESPKPVVYSHQFPFDFGKGNFSAPPSLAGKKMDCGLTLEKPATSVIPAGALGAFCAQYPNTTVSCLASDKEPLSYYVYKFPCNEHPRVNQFITEVQQMVTSACHDASATGLVCREK